MNEIKELEKFMEEALEFKKRWDLKIQELEKSRVQKPKIYKIERGLENNDRRK
ncbi:MAG: hypothetical protein ACOC5T_03865 [Elusimicrobiota bacterium]